MGTAGLAPKSAAGPPDGVHVAAGAAQAGAPQQQGEALPAVAGRCVHRRVGAWLQLQLHAALCCAGSAISSGLFVPMLMIGAVIGRLVGGGVGFLRVLVLITHKKIKPL